MNVLLPTGFSSGSLATFGAQPEHRTGAPGEELPRLAVELEADLIAIGGKAGPAFLEALLRGTQRTLLGGGVALLIVPR